MTKQEKIRDEVAGSIRLGICAFQHLGFDKAEMYSKIADKVVGCLDSQGVVIKVDRELPKVETFCQLAQVVCIPKLAVQSKMVGAGCGFFEPLIDQT